MKILIIVPAYNEEKTIKDVILDLKRFGYEVLVVDDGSVDQTAKLAEEAGARVLRHFINLGQGAAIKTGFDFALKTDAKIVVTFDADGQHLVEDIPYLVQPILEGKIEVVNGSRFQQKQNVPFSRWLMNQVANLVTFILFGVYSTDSQSGFKVFSRKALEELEIKANGFDWASEVMAEIKRKKIKFLEAPIKVRYSRYSLSKGQNFFVGIKTFFGLLLKKLLG